MERYQKAALNLHSMHVRDQKWLLDQLPNSQRGRLISMLDELKKLGVPREPVLLKEASTVKPAITGYSQIESLCHENLEHLSQVLEAEPDAMVVALLSNAGEWKDNVLTRFTSVRRERIDSVLNNSEQHLSGRACDALYEAAVQVMTDDTDHIAETLDNAPTQRFGWLRKVPWRK